MTRGGLDDPNLPGGEPIEGETFLADGWVYRDMPFRLSHEMWDVFLETLGKGNYRILIMSSTPGWKRGQFLISPKGMENLAAYHTANKAATVKTT